MSAKNVSIQTTQEDLPENLPENLPEDLAALSRAIYAAARSREGDCLALLALLRLLNELHYEIRDTLFREALPDNRQRLYQLLRDIEQQGGWPYIRRMKLLALLEHMEEVQNLEEIESAEDKTRNDISRSES